MSYLPGFLSERLLKKLLARTGLKADENAMYLYSNFIEMVWPYDDRGRLIGRAFGSPILTRRPLSSWTLLTF